MFKSKKVLVIVSLFLVVGIGLLSYTLFFGGTSGDVAESTVDDIDSSKTASVVITEQSSFSMFNEAITTASLTAKIDADDVTVFVPNNTAFKALPDGGTGKLLNTDIVSYHVITPKIITSELADKQKLLTVNGQELVVQKDDKEMFILDAKGNKAVILSSDLETSNGNIQEISIVLLPQ